MACRQKNCSWCGTACDEAARWDRAWVLATAARLKLEFTLRGPGRQKDSQQSVKSPFLQSEDAKNADPRGLRCRRQRPAKVGR